MNGKTAFLAAFSLVALESVAAAAPTAMPLARAGKQDLVDIEIRGAGGTTGDVILVTLRRKTPKTLRLTFTSGTVFESVTGKVQNLVGASVRGEVVGGTSFRPTARILLMDDDRHTFVVEAYSLDYHKAIPRSSDAFVLADRDERAAKIVQAGKQRSASIEIIQCAVWIDREKGLSNFDLKRRFSVGQEEIRTARDILLKLGSSRD